MRVVPSDADRAEEVESHTWRPVDLTAVLEGTYERPQPTVGRRADGVGLFYPGKLHTVAAETEAGKTWFALSACVDEMAAGNRVLYLDFEDDEGSVVGRLLTLGINRDLIRERFHYLRPTEPLAGTNVVDLALALAEIQPTLVIIDGITEAMVLHNLSPLDNVDVSAFGRRLLKRLTITGAAVVCLDHVTKDRENRGRYAIGAAHKLNGLDGAGYVLENRTPFGIGLTGRTTIRIAKDRPAALRRHALPGAGGMHWFGDLVVTSHGDEFAEVEVAAPSERSDEFRPTGLMSKIAGLLDTHGAMSGRQLQAIAAGKSTNNRRALTFLILDGYVSEDSPHRLLKPYCPSHPEEVDE